MKRKDEGGAGHGHRHARLEELILEELQGLFRDDVSDPALAGVRITRLVLAIDYRSARVHHMVQGDASLQLVEQRLQRVIPFLRARIGESLDLKRVPQLHFVLDAVAPREPI